MKVFREGIGAGAEKQYHLLSPHWNRGALPDCYLYWNAFTRDKERLESAGARGVPIISRVGGWHFGDSEETTGWVLRHSDGAIFVSHYTQQLARLRFGDNLPEHQAVIVNSAETVEHKPMADPPYFLVRAGGLGWPIWKTHMLSRSLSVVAAWKALPYLRRQYSGLTLKVVGRADSKLKEYCTGDGIEYVPYTSNRDELHDLGARAAALVHLVIGDHSPNTVCEIIGEGRPAIVLDKGGAREVAGRAAITIPTLRAKGKRRKDTDVWWPLDRHTYELDGVEDLGAYHDAIKNAYLWHKQARKRAAEIAPKAIAQQYADFIEAVCK